MNVSRFIAKRYFKAKKKRNVINLITKISVVGIAISTASLVILLSVFNGIEQMVVKLYSDFDSSLNIRSTQSKTFNQNFIDLQQIKSVKGVQNVSRALEEVIILKRGDKWVHAQMLGVDTTFLSMSKMKSHLVDGEPILYEDSIPRAIFGAGLLDKLGGYVPVSKTIQEQIVFNVPLREGKLRPGKNPLNTHRVSVSARMNYNREVNMEKVLIPYELANQLLEYGDDISAVFIETSPNVNISTVKKEIQKIIGDSFEVKTNMEKNELIFKTSETERLIIYFILIFVFILASFNLIASITMLFVEKKEDILTLYSIGADQQSIFRIFFYEGLIIVGRGVMIGLALGYMVVFLQLYFGFLQMPNVPGEVFPIDVSYKDAIAIVASTTILGLIISYFPTKIMVKKHPIFKR
ncbi:MAG: ABC transporter permease [Brumimicrobium sp.]|nr:ABC transporter permease [Brumimicrobium sp.]MCO5267349.1 ABC transporter permease [Brumimicrobium sp.]